MFQNSALIGTVVNQGGSGSLLPNFDYGSPGSGHWSGHNYPFFSAQAAAQNQIGGSSMDGDPCSLKTLVDQLRWDNLALQRRLEEQVLSSDFKLKKTQKEAADWKEQTTKLECELKALKVSTSDHRLITRELETFKVLTENWAHQLRRLSGYQIKVPSSPREMIETMYMDNLIGHVREVLAPVKEKKLWTSFSESVQKPAPTPSTSFHASESEEPFEVVESHAGYPQDMLLDTAPTEKRRLPKQRTSKPKKIPRVDSTEPRYFKCKMCPSSFKRLTALRTHMALHGVFDYMDGMVGCTKCGKVCSSFKTFRHHEATEHGVPLSRKYMNRMPLLMIHDGGVEMPPEQPDFPLDPLEPQ